MNDLYIEVRDLFAAEWTRDVARAVLILVAGWVVARLVKRRLTALGERLPSALLVRRVAIWLIWGIAVSWALREMGMNLGVLLGAAGVLTVALGFASQTSVSNVISGVFLMGERPFTTGDAIMVDGITGEVLSIDLLSIKLRTFDNLLVRIPNESVLKSPVTNLTHFPIRRYDLELRVAYDTDLAVARDALWSLVVEEPLCLVEPEPMLTLTGFAESSIDLRFSVWTTRENFLTLRKQLHERIVCTFAARGIRIPLPQRVLHFVPSDEPSALLGSGPSTAEARADLQSEAERPPA